MNIDFNWLTKLFTYSSIQVKFLATFVATVSLIFARRAILRVIVDRIKDIKLRYQWQKGTSYLTFIIGFLIIGQIWFDGIQSIATYLGLLSAGIAIALRDPLVNLVGWLYILWRNPLEVGDRVQLGEQAGDVIDISLFNFTLMEIGNWVNADQNTGRIIHIPNGQIFILTLANYGKGFKYIWNEISMQITYESDWRKAKKILEKIATMHSTHLTASAKRQFKKASRKFMIKSNEQLEPSIYISAEDNGIKLTIRYLCEPFLRRPTSKEIWEDVLTKFENEIDIEFAYPTVRRYNNETESKLAIKSKNETSNI